MIAGGNHTAIYGLNRTIIFAKGENANESPAGHVIRSTIRIHPKDVNGYQYGSQKGIQTHSERVAFTDAEGSADFFGNHNMPEVVNTAYNTCCFRISFSFSVASLGPLFEGAGAGKP